MELLIGPYDIRRIIINNFSIGEDVTIEAELEGNSFGLKTIVFEGVTKINCNPEHYQVSGNGVITAKDISDKNWKGVKYRVDILEDAFSFYCEHIDVR